MSGFFDLPPDWQKHWRGMPAFDQRDMTPMQTIMVHFRNAEDRDAFGKLIGQTITPKTKSVWFPKEVREDLAASCWTSDRKVNPKHPVYVISKGRWESRLTGRALESMGVPYHMVIEPQELPQYAAVMDEKKILTLPFSNLGKGSIPARNWCWKHCMQQGASRHWILDDNIRDFYRMAANMKHRSRCGNIFKAAEDFVDRYENVALAGFQYELLAPRKAVHPPYILNTRIYSCILIKNDLPHHWRGRYNEDTDLSLRCLKDGWCTVLFLAFLADKMATMTMSGGNTDQLYQGDGRLDMAKSLQEQHPDVVTITHKWDRWQHSVDYSPFKKNKLKLKGNVDSLPEVDNYGMYLAEDMTR